MKQVFLIFINCSALFVQMNSAATVKAVRSRCKTTPEMMDSQKPKKQQKTKRAVYHYYCREAACLKFNAHGRKYRGGKGRAAERLKEEMVISRLAVPPPDETLLPRTTAVTSESRNTHPI